MPNPTDNRFWLQSMFCETRDDNLGVGTIGLATVVSESNTNKIIEELTFNNSTQTVTPGIVVQTVLPATKATQNKYESGLSNGQETTVSGAVHNAFAAIYDESEFPTETMYSSVSGEAVVLEQEIIQSGYQDSLTNITYQYTDYSHPNNQEQTPALSTTTHSSFLPTTIDECVNYEEPVIDILEATQSNLFSTSFKESMYLKILNCLQTDENASKKNSWSTKTINDLSSILSNKDNACKTLSGKELKICLCILKEEREKQGITYCKSWSKGKLCDALLAIFNPVPSIKNSEPSQRRTRRTYKSPPKLASLVSKYINSIPKESLCAVLSEEMWPSKYRAWSEQSPFQNDTRLNDMQTPIRWFSKPQMDEDNSIRFHFTDCCHILTCLRTKLCTTGIKGLRKQAWEKAAESEETTLNIAIVVECIDKQSVAFANRMFGEDVEKCMVSHGFEKEAEFVRIIRKWFEAEDAPGISSTERCKRRIELRNYLLDDMNFGRFPPCTQYVNGFPIVTYEGLVIHLERKLQFYCFAPGGMYNTRALGTQEVEQFFSCMRDLDPSGIGTPKPDDIPDMIATAVMLDNTRIDPERPFYMKTSRAAVYPDALFHDLNERDEAMEFISETAEISGNLSKNTEHRRKDITTADHFFDLNERKRVRGKQKTGILSEADKQRCQNTVRC